LTIYSKDLNDYHPTNVWNFNSLFKLCLSVYGRQLADANEKNDPRCTVEKQTSKRGLFHRLQDRVKAVKQESVFSATTASVSALEHSVT
jgi:hypothetical protein